MRNFLLLLFSLHSLDALACSCWDYHRDMNRAYKEYAFIAHVKIVKKSMVTAEDSSLEIASKNPAEYRKLAVEIIELYKGTLGITILEWGVGSSCDTGIRENDEWILFGNYINKQFVAVNFCNTWFRLANAAGERQWMYDGSTEAMKQLRKLANIPEKKIADGRSLSYYDNGAKLADEGYKDGLLDGNRKIYFANGNMMKEGEFRMGKPVGLQKEFAQHGQLLSELFYENGQITHSAWWFDTAYQERKMRSLFLPEFSEPGSILPAGIQKSSEGWYDTLTGNRHSFVFSWDGKIEKENFMFSDQVSNLSCEYYKTGTLKADTRYFKDGNISIEKRYDEKGTLISDKRWEKGKLVYQSN